MWSAICREDIVTMSGAHHSINKDDKKQKQDHLNIVFRDSNVNKRSLIFFSSFLHFTAHKNRTIS